VSESGHALIFVYGTLKRGGSNHAFLIGQTFLQSARTVAGYSLVHLRDFPGMIPDEMDRIGVAGEVWKVDLTCLAQLDDLEGVDEGLYRREAIQLQGFSENERVETYLYAGDILDRPRLPHGHWP
jgi:gamma-glutamylcyclotransferase (GGCT)/AIG2-like uncharacterized protein YtfP